MYGQSRVLAGHTCNANDCTSWIGKDHTLQVPKDSSALGKEWSQRFQWLPTEFEVSHDTPDIIVKSYINNLHPRNHSELYSIIAQIVGKAIPLWNRVLSRLISPPMALRVSDWSNYEKLNTMPEQEESEDEDDFDERYEEWQEARLFYEEPEPGTFKTPAERVKGYMADRPFDVPGMELQDEVEKLSFDIKPCVNLRRDFRRLQIIVKLANIHLTPEKPEYAGGSWHVEGQANESMYDWFGPSLSVTLLAC